MKKRLIISVTAILLSVSTMSVAYATITEVPEPFQASDEQSTFRIKYDDVSKLLRHAVVITGQSTRQSANMPYMKTGTRLRQTIKRSTANEGNRLYYEWFEGDDTATLALGNIKKSLEVIPGQISLAAFSRDEQLAYWLNLYNMTLINEIAKIYPKHNLKSLLVGEDSILNKKTMNVAGIPLSLNDIEFILWKNYNGDPLVVYGLYQGVVGGPNIRRAAYTGKNVYRSLRNNAKEFTNSNRGTQARSENTFRVSSLYDRDTPFFKSDAMLKQHLLTYLEFPESDKLRSTGRIKRDINDWTIADLYGSYKNMAGSLADSRVALMDVQGISPSHVMGNFYETPGNGRYSHDLLVRLGDINERRIGTARQNSTVTVEELGAVDVEPESISNDGA